MTICAGPSPPTQILCQATRLWMSPQTQPDYRKERPEKRWEGKERRGGKWRGRDEGMGAPCTLPLCLPRPQPCLRPHFPAWSSKRCWCSKCSHYSGVLVLLDSWAPETPKSFCPTLMLAPCMLALKAVEWRRREAALSRAHLGWLLQHLSL